MNAPALADATSNPTARTMDYVLTFVVNAVPCSVVVAAPSATAIHRQVLTELRRALEGAPLGPTDILSSMTTTPALIKTLQDSWENYVELANPTRRGSLLAVLNRASTVTGFIDSLYTAPYGGNSTILYDDCMSHPILARLEPVVRAQLP